MIGDAVRRAGAEHDRCRNGRAEVRGTFGVRFAHVEAPCQPRPPAACAAAAVVVVFGRRPATRRSPRCGAECGAGAGAAEKTSPKTYKPALFGEADPEGEAQRCRPSPFFAENSGHFSRQTSVSGGKIQVFPCTSAFSRKQRDARRFCRRFPGKSATCAVHESLFPGRWATCAGIVAVFRGNAQLHGGAPVFSRKTPTCAVIEGTSPENAGDARGNSAFSGNVEVDDGATLVFPPKKELRTAQERSFQENAAVHGNRAPLTRKKDNGTGGGPPPSSRKAASL